MAFTFYLFFIFSDFRRNWCGSNAIFTGRFSTFAVGLIASTTGQIDIYTIIPLLVLAALLGDNELFYRENLRFYSV